MAKKTKSDLITYKMENRNVRLAINHVNRIKLLDKTDPYEHPGRVEERKEIHAKIALHLISGAFECDDEEARLAIEFLRNRSQIFKGTNNEDGER